MRRTLPSDGHWAPKSAMCNVRSSNGPKASSNYHPPELYMLGNAGLRSGTGVMGVCQLADRRASAM